MNEGHGPVADSVAVRGEASDAQHAVLGVAVEGSRSVRDVARDRSVGLGLRARRKLITVGTAQGRQKRCASPRTDTGAACRTPARCRSCSRRTRVGKAV